MTLPSFEVYYNGACLPDDDVIGSKGIDQGSILTLIEQKFIKPTPATTPAGASPTTGASAAAPPATVRLPHRHSPRRDPAIWAFFAFRGVRFLLLL